MGLYSDPSFPANIDPTPSTNAAITRINMGTSPMQILAANPNRKGFSIYNDSNRILYVGTTSSVSTVSGFFVKIPANTFYVWSLQSIYNGAIFAIASGANAPCQVFELTP